MTWESVLLIIGSYFLGSIPTAYLVGKALKGIDIRRYGSGNVGGQNVWQWVSRWVGVAVVLIDFGKGIIPVAIALALDMGLAVAMGAGLAAVIGHNWPIFLGFSGGRGVGLTVGIVLFLTPWVFLAFASICILFAVLRNAALGITLGIIALPFACWEIYGELPLILGYTAMILIIFTRRLTASPRPWTLPAGRRQVVLYRILFDRDVREKKDWVERAPVINDPESEGSI